MGDEKEPKGSDLRVKAGLTPEGGGAFELGINNEAAGWLGKLAPKWAARSRSTLAVTDEIIGRLRRGEQLTDADANFLGAIGATAEAQWVRQARQLQIAQKAQELYPLLPPATSEHDSEPEIPPLRTPTDDWSEKYWEDAGLVSDEVMQQVYARILAGEARAPGSFSLRTLRAVRYLDPEVAKMFHRACSLAVRPGWLPASPALLEKYGVSFRDRNELDDAGLLQHDENTRLTVADPQIFGLYGTLVFRFAGQKKHKIPIYNFKRAGRELATIADVSRSADYFLDMLRYLARQLSCTIHWVDAAGYATEPPESAWQVVSA